jgi:predicted nucleic acid-binding protein
LRDDGDQPVLNTLIEAIKISGADYLITGGKDLLLLSGRYRIVSQLNLWIINGWL